MIDKNNVGKIAERIVMNELEASGYGVSDLNKDRVASNADVIAVKGKRTWQIQVKGATNKEREHWWVQYGYCNDDLIGRRTNAFNARESFYLANYVALVAVKSPAEYRCFVLPIDEAEKLAQLNMDRYYRQPKTSNGEARKPGKMWVNIDPLPKERRQSDLLDKERAILKKYEARWILK